jgi:hypothetical protein
VPLNNRDVAFHVDDDDEFLDTSVVKTAARELLAQLEVKAPKLKYLVRDHGAALLDDSSSGKATLVAGDTEFAAMRDYVFTHAQKKHHQLIAAFELAQGKLFISP